MNKLAREVALSPDIPKEIADAIRKLRQDVFDEITSENDRSKENAADIESAVTSIESAVKTSGDQTITGVKNFTGTLKTSGYVVAGVSQSTSGSETVYPIGAILTYDSGGVAVAINTAVIPYLGTGVITHNMGTVAILGTWRIRGRMGSSTAPYFIIQRVA